MNTYPSIRIIAALLAIAVAANAQTTRPEPAAAVPQTQPTVDGQQALSAEVVDVAGDVLRRPSATGGQFVPVRRGDRLPGGTLVTAGPASQAVISFGDNSVVVIEQFSTVTIDEVYQQARFAAPTVVTRLKLKNGSVRAGVERGRTQSDFQIATPVATLSVRGTRPIRAFYDAGTGQLWFYLAREGWITGMVAGGGRNVDILPGQGTNQTLTLPVMMAMFDRHIQLGDPFGQTLNEYLVEVFNTNAVGGFGGGSPQTIGQVIDSVTGGQSGSSGNSGGGDDGDDDDSFYDEDDDSFYNSKKSVSGH